MTEVIVQHERPESQRSRCLGGHTEGEQRRELRSEVVGEEQSRIAEVLGFASEVPPPRERVAAAGDAEAKRTMWHVMQATSRGWWTSSPTWERAENTTAWLETACRVPRHKRQTGIIL